MGSPAYRAWKSVLPVMNPAHEFFASTMDLAKAPKYVLEMYTTTGNLVRGISA